MDTDASALLRHEPLIRALVRHKARLLRGRSGLTTQDFEDLSQHVRLAAARALAAYDPQRGPVTAFLHAVVVRAAAGFLRDHFAARRDPRDVRRLPARGAKLLAHDTVSGNAATDCGLDVAAVLAGLPPDLHATAELLQRMSVSEAARALGVPRTTLYGRLRRLRQRFENAGLRIYL